MTTQRVDAHPTAPSDTSHTPTGGTATWRGEASAMIRFATPLALTQLALMGILTTDTIMIGWLGASALAAGTLAGHVFWIFEFASVGLLVSVAPMMAQHLGARRFRKIRETVRQGFWIAFLVAIPCIFILWHSGDALVFLGQDPALSGISQSYLRVMAFSLIPGLLHLILSEFLIAHDRPRATLVVGIMGVVVNGFANYAFMFGNYGFPAMGLVGAAVASVIVTTLMFVAMLLFIETDRRFRRYHLLGYFWHPDWPQFKEIFTIGIPIAMTDVAEVATVLVASLLMGLISVDALAAHGVTVQCIVILIIVPVGLMQAASVRVGRALGAQEHRVASRAGYAAMGLGFINGALVAIVFVFFGDKIVGIYLDDDIVENRAAIALATSFIAVAAHFYVADSMQLITRGALMGLKDTKVPMIFALGSYTFSLPAAAYFGVYLGYGGQAIWLSLTVPLSVLAVLLIRRFRSKCRQSV